MEWHDEGYLLSKNNFDENSIIIEALTCEHGKYSGIVYGGSSRKIKKNFQIGNKITLNWKSKNVNKMGYFNVELIKPISPYFFNDKKRSICILAASSLLKILLPERQKNKVIYNSFDVFINQLSDKYWIQNYIFWELSLLKELGFDTNFLSNETAHENFINFNGSNLKIPTFLINKKSNEISDSQIRYALNFNKNLIVENIIEPNKLRFPISRNILENYFK